MSACKTLIRSSTPLHALEWRLGSNCKLPFPSLHLPPSQSHGLGFKPYRVSSRCYTAAEGAVLVESTDLDNEETLGNSSKDNVAQILSNPDDVALLMKMERRPLVDAHAEPTQPKRWFPYLDQFKCGNYYLNSGEVLEAVSPCIMDVRKERFKNVVKNRSYSVCLVVEGLSDFGNVSAAFRSADALGFQSVHVVSCDSSKRYRENRHVSMGAEKWLDIELWDSIEECFSVLRSRGYRIATTHVGMDAVSIYDMDWSCPTAIVVGNENRGISDEALKLSDLRCSIPMNGMVDSFNVSVAAGLLMHQAVCDRTARSGCHGDLTAQERQILLAEFSLRHSKTTITIAHEYAKKKASALWSKL